jgi:predicted MFS family arabinose efflux permease
MKIFFLICSIIYKNYLIEKDKKKVVFWACIISFSSSCFFNIYLTFNLKSKIIVFLSISLYVSIKTICSKPMSDIVLLLSPSGYEGSIMGLNGSAISFGKTVSTFFGSLLTAYFKVEKNDYSNFNFMIFVHNIISLLSLFGLLLIDDEILVHAEENSKKKKKSDSNNTEIEVDIYNESTALKEINYI